MTRNYIGNFCLRGYKPFYVGTVMAECEIAAEAMLLNILRETGLYPEVDNWEYLTIIPGKMCIFTEEESKTIAEMGRKL